MKKKSLANFIMAGIILVIVAAGIFTVGSIRGWFDNAEGTALLQNMRGMVKLQRSGVSTVVQADLARGGGAVRQCYAVAHKVHYVPLEDLLARGLCFFKLFVKFVFHNFPFVVHIE